MAGTPHSLQPKLSSDSPKLPESSHQVALPPDTESSHLNGDLDSTPAYGNDVSQDGDSEGPADDDSSFAAPDQHESALSQPVSEHQSNEHATVGGRVSPPSPYSEEGSRAAQQRLAEVPSPQPQMCAWHLASDKGPPSPPSPPCVPKLLNIMHSDRLYVLPQ